MQPIPDPALSVGDELGAVHARLSGILLTRADRGNCPATHHVAGQGHPMKRRV
jgi:hypothetical protein